MDHSADPQTAAANAPPALSAVTSRALGAAELFVGLLEIGGGILAVPIVWDLLKQFAQASPRGEPTQTVSFVLGFLISSAYFLSVAAGIGLLLERRWARVLSVVVQALHLPVLSFAGGVYFVVIGWNCVLSLWPMLGVRMFFGSKFSVWLGGQEAGGTTLGINMVALAAILVLATSMEQQARTAIPGNGDHEVDRRE